MSDPHRPGEDSVGSLAEEAARFAEAVTAWGRTQARGPGGASEAGNAAGASGCAHDVEGRAPCTLCPLCQGLELLRGARPEVYAHLGDAAAAVLAALRELVGERTAGGAHPSAAAQSTAVQRIVVD